MLTKSIEEVKFNL